MMRIDVVLLAFNRPKHTARSIDSLVANGVEEIYLYLDGAKNNEDEVNRGKIKEVIRSFERIDIALVERAENYGLAKNLRSAITEQFSHGADAVVVLEDDCLLAQGGYEFFKQGLEATKDNKKIRSLCGYLPRGCGFYLDPSADLLLLSRFSTWGWATWADRWSQYEPNLRKLVDSAHSLGVRLDDFAGDLDRFCGSADYLDGKVDIWSINWILLHYLTSTFAVYPPESIIDNIGLDRSGVNCTPNDNFKQKLKKHIGTSYRWDKIFYFPENELKINDFMLRNSRSIYPE